MRAEWEGRFADADELERQARQLDTQRAEPLAPLHDLGKACARDEPERLAGIVEQARRFYPEQAGMLGLLYAMRDAETGHREQARQHLRELPAPGIAALLVDFHAIVVAASVAWELRDRALAALVMPTLEPFADRCCVITGIGFTLYGRVDHSLLRLAALLGRAEDVERHAASALAALTRLRATPFIAALNRDLALALRELDPKAHLARSLALLAAACAGYEQLGLHAAAARCRALSHALPSRTPSAPGGPPAVSAPALPATSSVQCTREGEYWHLTGLGNECRSRDGRGMRMLAQLLDSPGRELHVLDLSGALDAVDGGDAGELIDKSARVAYEQRLRELAEELEQAAAWNDAGRRERLEQEAQALRSELARALGLGGRERRSGSATERARVNVRRRIALALRRIEDTCPALGRHLSACVRTGVYCAYEPPGAG
jgi:hypothetical protein